MQPDTTYQGNSSLGWRGLIIKREYGDDLKWNSILFGGPETRRLMNFTSHEFSISQEEAYDSMPRYATGRMHRETTRKRVIHHTKHNP
ncbi:Protein of unknown function [Pyronema omphalodes CBS 100304]|uniref:Uncharacterized protein n=1 Tax=Pyronema omphalodes (strain CBS 100304) TaxID=1076935 RepID=U4L1L7_PYROM|nr:Protein of unknown function [Pyronema omphalodes CBS 100304]